MIFQPHGIPNEPILEDCQRRRQHSSGIFFNYDLSGIVQHLFYICIASPIPTNYANIKSAP